MAKKAETITEPVSKIRGRVFSTENPISKIRGRVLSTDEPVSKMAALLEKESVAPKFSAKGERVDGKVVAILSDAVLVDIGAKSEGMIPLREMVEEKIEAKVGAPISAIVAQAENDSGTIILTLKKGIKEKAWEDLQKAVDADETLNVKGVDANRGGLVVEYNGLRGFIPSQHLTSNAKESINSRLSVKVLEVDKNLNRLVLSEKEVTGDNLSKIELPFKAGDVLDTVVSKILPFGLLVSLDKSPEGLIHISEISWTRIENLANTFKVGDKLKAKVISIDSSNGKVNLSIKQLEKDPWQQAAKEYPVGKALERPVSRVTNYGVFVQIEEGIEGLLHSSKIPYGVSLKVGDKIKVSIDLFNSEQRRVALRLAQEDAEVDIKAKKKPVKKKNVKKTD